MKTRFAYRTDISIPNLDAMSQSALHKFAVRAARAARINEGAKADWLRLASRYAAFKLKAMDMRRAGHVGLASRYEAECEQIYAQIPKRMKW